jgi:hypothetical protein
MTNSSHIQIHKIYSGSIINVIQNELTTVTTLKTMYISAHPFSCDSKIPASQLWTDVPKSLHYKSRQETGSSGPFLHSQY